MTNSFHSGFVAILGRPNAGKSTLLNRLVGQKVAIVSAKPQTTRNRIQGIVNREGGQIVFIDTPGIHRGESALGRQMMHEIAAATEGVNVLLLMGDASRAMGGTDELLLERAQSFRGPVILALNQIDRMHKPRLLPLLGAYGRGFAFTAIVPISALTGAGTEELLEEITRVLPEGERYFAEDQVTDQPERFLAAEIVREKAIQITYHEVPYALAVVVDKYEETPKILRIHATLQVERDSQKKILIGSGGAMLKRVGTAARKELEGLLERKIYLELFVKVMPGWRDDPEQIRQLDWHTQLEEMAEGESEEE